MNARIHSAEPQPWSSRCARQVGSRSKESRGLDLRGGGHCVLLSKPVQVKVGDNLAANPQIKNTMNGMFWAKGKGGQKSACGSETEQTVLQHRSTIQTVVHPDQQVPP